MHINTNTIVNAVEKHGTLFLDAKLNPIVPEPGQWFAEYDDDFDLGESNFCRPEAMVEYVGPDDSVCWDDAAGAFLPHGDPKRRHLVAPEYSDGVRRPGCRALIRQA